MDGIALWKNENLSTVNRLMYVGDAVVLEQVGNGKPIPHYLETKAESVEFMIKSAYALLSLGYKVVE